MSGGAGMIKVQNLRKSFGNFPVIQDVSFIVEEGKLASVLGPSGSGKSTLLRLIAGLEMPDSGDIYFGDRRVNDIPVRKREIGFVFQDYALFGHMNVRDNIAFGLNVRGIRGKKALGRVRELLDLINMRDYENHYPHQLSGGQRQRVALARALAPSPKLLLLDEPFGSLDAKVRYNLGLWLRKFHREVGVTSIFVTHDQKEAMEISDKIILVNRGKVEQVGTPEEIYNKPATKFVASFIGRVNVLDGFVENGILICAGGGFSLNVTGDEDFEDGEAVLLLRPEDLNIGVEGDAKEGSGNKTFFRARIIEVRYLGDHYEVIVEINGIEIKGIVSKNVMESRKLIAGDETIVSFSKYIWFPAKEGLEKLKERLRNLGYIE